MLHWKAESMFLVCRLTWTTYRQYSLEGGYFTNASCNLDEHTEPSPGGFLSGLEASRVQGYQESFGGNNMKYLQKAVDSVEERFPFNGYMAPWHCAYLNVAQTVLRHLPDRGSILDFASGPCDKTAVLQELGYACSAYDDLQDDWHLIEGNKENILSFAE